MSIYEEYGELIVQQEILQAQVNAVRIKINTDIERKENEKEAKKESRSQENKKSEASQKVLGPVQQESKKKG